MSAGPWLIQAQEQRLHEDPQWRRLLHFQPGAADSEVTSPGFFLAPNGRRSPQAELIATLNGWFESAATTADDHPRCRFPARYAWLQARLQLPEPTGAPLQCPAFETWALPDNLRSISLVMVSGFLGNPASSFGHAVLKLNHHGELPGGRLLDLSFNFGADVPDHEPMPIYLANGLFGGYEAGFSVGPYFSRDQVYLRSEFRDLWEYQLSLTPEESLRIAGHLWELRGQHFTYYFLSQNCAYRLAELLTLATGAPYTPRARVWYTPVELFHSLDVETGRAEPLVAEIRFIPSSQRVLYRQYSRLSRRDAATLNDLIREGPDGLAAALTGLAPEQQLALTDTLLAYYEYRLAATAESQPDPAMRAAKDQVLRERLTLPPQIAEPPAPPPPAPNAGEPPMLAAIGADFDHRGAGTLLRFAPYFQDLIGRHSAEGTELKVLDSQLRIGGGRIELDHIDVIGVRKLADAPDIQGESQLSWHAATGVRRQTPVDLPHSDNPLRLQATAGAGRALRWSDNTLAYASLDATALSGGPFLRSGPSLGLLTGDADWWRARAQLGGEFDIRDGHWSSHINAEARLSLQRRLELRIGWEQWEGESAGWVAIHRYW